MSTIVTRAGKGAPLTHNEVDANFNNLNTDKVEKTAAAITGGAIDGTTIGGTTRAAGSFTTVTTTNDASISGLTVGKGGGGISTNTVLGENAFVFNTTGAENTVVGRLALAYNTTGSRNLALGHTSLYSNTTGSSNIAVGEDALRFNTTASNNTAVGYQAGYSNTTGTRNTYTGYQSGYASVTGPRNSGFGNKALYANTGSDNSAFGDEALVANTSGVSNTGIGQGVLNSNTTGSYNAALGGTALVANTTGSNNSGLGYQALFNNTTASNNTAVGYQAGYSNTTGSANFYAGYQAGYSGTTTGFNTSIGYQSGYNANVGAEAGNTFIGAFAGNSVTTGTANTFIGGYLAGSSSASGSSITTGSKNSIIGNYNGNQGGLDIRTASNYIVLSDGDGNPRQIIDGSGNLLVGTSDSSETTGVGTKIKIDPKISIVGNSATSSSTFITTLNTNATNNGYRFYVRYDGGIYNYSANNFNLSDETEKTEITLSNNYLDKLCQIPVKTFLYKDQNDSDLNLGVIAQDVEKVCPEFITKHNMGTEEEPNIKLGVYETDLKYAMLKAIQELNAKLEVQALEIATLKAR